VAATQSEKTNPSGSRFEYTQIHMGVAVRLAVYAPDEVVAKQACAAAFARVAQLEDVASDYRPTSELMRFCAHFDTPGVPALRLSDDLWKMLAHAQFVSEKSRGAFDVTVSPLVRLWRQSRQSKVLPTREQVRQAQRLVGWQKLQLNAANQSARLLVPGMRLDLGGIAKGYAADEAQKVLRMYGITSALFEAGGDIVVSNAPPDSSGWKVRLPAGRTLLLQNGAVSTSGDTIQWVEIGGKRYSHIVDVKSGLGLTKPWLATVIAPDGITSDSLSTAACVLGPKRARRLSKYFKGIQIEVRKARQTA
jgi:thiamine biosynthesis lipoprotein